MVVRDYRRLALAKFLKGASDQANDETGDARGDGDRDNPIEDVDYAICPGWLTALTKQRRERTPEGVEIERPKRRGVWVQKTRQRIESVFDEDEDYREDDHGRKHPGHEGTASSNRVVEVVAEPGPEPNLGCFRCAYFALCALPV